MSGHLKKITFWYFGNLTYQIRLRWLCDNSEFGLHRVDEIKLW